ncbi:hypothetical protein [Halodesulfurarchaeum sp.]|uniref:hypothetical protein n=1 Tax=Halodesulfurarchaeum sp. TaxID=1980530 RepID=UPI001BBB40E7|nr:hypothetical protein [Halodesulfurarchaeum sp.]
MNVNRRQVLAAIAGIGSIGAVAGSGTGAVFQSRSGFDVALQSGILDLAVSYDIVSGPGADDPETNHGTVNGPRLDIPIGSLDESNPAGRTDVTFSLPESAQPNNPAALWLATDCPIPASTALAEAVTLRLSTVDCDTGETHASIISGSLRSVAEAMQTGVRIDGDPTTAPVECLTDQVCVSFEYELTGYVGTETVELPLWFGAVQCRNDLATNPFGDREPQPCPPGEDCPCCRTLGKLELEAGTPGMDESFIEPGTYAFTEGDTSYGLEIYAIETKDGGTETTGVAFRLVNLEFPDGLVPSLCTVAVKGGRGFVQYDGDESTAADTAGLPTTSPDGIVSAPTGKAISHITVCVCTTESPEDCDGCGDPSLPGLESVGALLDPREGGR